MTVPDSKPLWRKYIHCLQRATGYLQSRACLNILPALPSVSHSGSLVSDNEIKYIPPISPEKAEQVRKLREMVLEAIDLWNPPPVKNQKQRSHTAASLIAVHLFTHGVRALVLLLTTS